MFRAFDLQTLKPYYFGQFYNAAIRISLTDMFLSLDWCVNCFMIECYAR